MFDLVVGVEAYPSFLPWCQSAEVLERFDDGVRARLGLAYMGVKHSFSTRNHNVVNESVHLELIDGPFSVLEGHWAFKPLGPASTAAPAADPANAASAAGPAEEAKACKIEFDLSYAFSSKALETVVSPVFDKVANTFVDSFVKRAEQVYGPRG